MAQLNAVPAKVCLVVGITEECAGSSMLRQDCNCPDGIHIMRIRNFATVLSKAGIIRGLRINTNYLIIKL